MGFFEDKGAMLLNVIKLFDPSVTDSYMGDLRPLAVTGIGIYFLWLMIPLLLGKGEGRAEDALSKILVWSIVFAFAFNGSGYLDMVQNGMNEIFTWSGGGKGFFKNLDTWYASLSTAGETFYEMDKSKYVKFQGAIAQIIILIGAMVLAIIPFLIVIASSMLMQVIIMLAPFLILALVFPALKTVFYNGLGLFLRVTFAMLIISIIQKSFVSKIDSFVIAASKSASNSVNVDLIGSSVLILVMCIVYGGMLYSAVPVSKIISGSIYSIKVGNKNL